MEDFDVLSLEDLFFFCTLLRVSKQSVISSISLALTIIDLKIVTREFLSSADLSRAQILCVYKLTEVVVIGK